MNKIAVYDISQLPLRERMETGVGCILDGLVAAISCDEDQHAGVVLNALNDWSAQ